MSGSNGNNAWQWGSSYPKDINVEVDPVNGRIPIQTDNQNVAGQSGPSGQSTGATASTGQHADVAGVLKRNQACLQCRRRKLKCDATRPHCATCIRSHKHTLRTSPNSGAVLTCDYDDGMPSGSGSGIGNANAAEKGASASSNGTGGGEQESPGSNENDEDSGSARKKRKATTGTQVGGKKKESEADKLRRKIEELEAQLANKSTTAPQGSTETHRTVSIDATAHPWAVPVSAGSGIHTLAPDISAQSPTAFLEMLSSAATAHHPSRSGSGSGSGSGFGSNQNPNGALKEGRNGTTMVTGGVFHAPTPLADNDTTGEGQSTGLTPFFSYGSAETGGDRPRIEHIDSDQSDLTRPGSGSGPGVDTSSHHNESGGYNNNTIPPLTPSAVFNFPPTPAGVNYTIPTQSHIPQFDEQGNMKPSEKLDGPWRAIETVDTMLAGAGIPMGNGNVGNGNNGMPGMDGMQGQFSMQDQAEGIMPNLPPMDEATQQQLLMDLFWPGWPVNLPEPNIVNDLTEAFFELVPGLPRLLHRGRFLARLALPPTHSNFPHPSLIHSICSIASNWCAPALYERSNIARAFDPKTGKEINFALRQASLAKDSVHEGLNTGNRMFDVVRAMMILSRIFIDDTRMLECWAYNGLVARMILPLGLNVRSAGLSLKSVMLPPPTDAIEREERRASMWFAVYHDTIASAASGWGTSIALDELSIPLPVSAKDFESGQETMESNPQDLDSPDLYTRHPVSDPFVMVVKASVLLNRVNKFARKWKNRHVRDHDDYEGMARGEFRELSNSIACFQMSFPHELRNPCRVGPKRRLDVDLIAAHLMPHAAIICLYEPFANLDDPGDQAAQRILNAAQAIVGTVQQMAALVLEGVQNFSTVMHSSTSICLVTSARTCLLFYRHALNKGDHAMAESLRCDVEMIRMALAQLGLRFKIGHHHSQLVEYFMDRASNPTYDKMSAHYPEHPRAGAPVLHPNADLGVCVMNALNVKRGYWRIATPHGPTSTSANGSGFGYQTNQPNARQSQDGISPFGSSSTPGSSGASGYTSGQSGSYTTVSSAPRQTNPLTTSGTYPDPPDPRDLLCQTGGGVTKANEESRYRSASASHSASASASNSASHSPLNYTGSNEPTRQQNAAMQDYMTQGNAVPLDDTANIGFMLPNIGVGGGNIAAPPPSDKGSDKWAIMEHLFTSLRSDGTRDSFGLNAQENSAAGSASLGARTGVVQEVQPGRAGETPRLSNEMRTNLNNNFGGGQKWNIAEECKRAV